ncbi:single-stranded DNA-binding protein [Alloscardovia macacae]|uniref:Single-stranded DNA-binding protein n=1 Tax=Alloscardovia macacae TaxID=1160091 RepID=A0A1Y2SW38_9BIFI|nr:single-stranded DNA-binding protein [Alloscardovia macacae]OTA25674.1 single-stranded DNA-binding protein [Alloscardovia macacae]OTA29611.1 single-stranded DNA-binding protein [Alloscardovia macacae]
MAGETVITVVGNLTADPELRTTGNGGTVVNFTIASTPRTYNRNTGQWDDGDALFMRCSCWDSQYTTMASNIAQTLTKGMRVIAQGNLVQRSYQTQNGESRTVVELRVTEIGPSLSRATAQVNRISSAGAGSGAGNGYQGGRGFNGGYQGGGAGAPNYANGAGSSYAQQGGYAPAAPVQAAPAAQTAPAAAPQSAPAPSTDPWGADDSDSSFGGSSDFGGSFDPQDIEF